MMLRHMLLTLAMVLLCTSVAWAQDKNPAFDKLFAKANEAYNGSDYASAIKFYKLSAQENPSRADVYRNMARAYFWLSQYPAAVAYYDIYLVRFPRAPDNDQIERERRLASSRDPSPWALPSGQRLALENLEKALKDQTAMARGGRGAWKAYQALLQSGYAHPDLIKFRKTLSERLLAEHDAALVVDGARVTPVLNLDAWELEKEHLDAALKVTDDAKARAKIERRSLLHAAATALLLGRYDEAAAKAQTAAEQNPEFLFPQWWRIAALMHAGKAQQALTVLESLGPKLRDQPPEHRQYALVLRALLLQQLGKHEEATKIFVDIL